MLGRLRSGRIGALAALAAVLCLAAPAAADDDPVAVLRGVEKAFISVARKVSPSVVSISVKRAVEAAPEGSDKIPEDWRKFLERPISAGSGVFISPDGLILTNNHVIEDASKIEVRTSDGRPLAATLVQTDSRSDLAVIRVPATGLKPAVFNTSGRVEVGQWVIALGNPFGFGRDGRATMTHGVVSAVRRSLPSLGRLDDRYYGHLIQTDAPINPGNSGGPLLNIDGQVIGINTAIYSTSRGSQGIGFAIPIDGKTMSIIARLRAGREVVYGYLGVGIIKVTEEDAQRLGVPPRRGALVRRVEADTPAARGGLRKDDVIVSFNGIPMSDEDDLIREVGATPVGAASKVEIIREGERMVLSVTLAKRPVAAARTRPGRETRPSKRPTPPRSDWRGLTVQPLTEALAERLGLAEAKGVIVATCRRGSPAYEAGLRAGFVIDQIGKARIENVGDFNRVTAGLAANWKGLVHTNHGFYIVGP